MLRIQWNALVWQMERPQVFYTYEWALTVEHAYRDSMRPLLVLGYEGDALIGAAALATDQSGSKAFFLASTTADYCDFICLPHRRQEFLTAVFAELHSLDLPMLVLANLPADSATSLPLAAGSSGYALFSRPAYLCAQLALGEQAERQALQQSVNKRKALRYALNNLAKSGVLRVEHLRGWESIQPALPEFFQAHIARFRAMGRTSNLESPQRQLFLTNLAQSLSKQGWLTLTRLLTGDRPVAWNYGFQFAGSWFYYQPTFDSGLRQFSPGFCLLSKIIEEACDNPEIELLDLGLGEEGYKHRFATTSRQTLHVTATTSTARRVRESVRYHAASAIKSAPRLEHWVRRLTGRTSSESVPG